MPNGGTHHCYGCEHYVVRSKRCKLRKVKIENYYRTTCLNRTIPYSDKKAPKKVTGPLYTITNDDGRYCELPYFEGKRVEIFNRGKGEIVIFTDQAGRYYICDRVAKYLQFYEQCMNNLENREEFKKKWRSEQRLKIQSIRKVRSPKPVPVPIYGPLTGDHHTDVINWSKSHIGFNVNTWSSEKFWQYMRNVLKLKGVVETCKELALKQDEESMYALWLIRSISMRHISWCGGYGGIPYGLFGWVAKEIHTVMCGKDCKCDKYTAGEKYYGLVDNFFLQLRPKEEWKNMERKFERLGINQHMKRG